MAKSVTIDSKVVAGEIIAPDFLDARDFMVVLRRERYRTDRSMTPFTLALFDPSPTEASRVNGSRSLETLAGIVCDESRLSDAKGWYIHENRYLVALLMSETSPEDSKRIVDAIAARYTQQTPRASLMVLIWAYPDNETSESIQRFQTPGIQALDATAAEVTRELCVLPTWKRVLDLTGSSLGLLLSSPLFLCVALLIKWLSPGPVFFRQKRIGFNGKPFFMYKFRSMHTGVNVDVHREYIRKLIRETRRETADAEVPMYKILNDNRVIPGGHLIRNTSIDELPQLINVWKGEMSLVGPRPSIPYEVEEFALWQKERLHTVPGMTGLWQVSGKNRMSFKQMVRLDIRYGRNLNLLEDLKILVRTPLTVWEETLASHPSRLMQRRPSGKMPDAAEQ
ncbi:MAG: sugar transferase [bacterium]|jgi:lipopolysaccharide/colanic/teichoic acid biosynthesis glycosyltransferase